jgi:hypothetical protein
MPVDAIVNIAGGLVNSLVGAFVPPPPPPPPLDPEGDIAG